MKIGIICFDFRKENINKQPWVYIYKLSCALIDKGIDLFLISNNSDFSIDSMKIYKVRKLSLLILCETEEILSIFKKEKPDVVISLLGVTSLLRLHSRVTRPIIGILTSPIYSLDDLRPLIPHDLIKYFRYLCIHLIGSILPFFILIPKNRYFMNVVVLSEFNKKKLSNFCSNISVIRPGFDETVGFLDVNRLKRLRKTIAPDSYKIITYFTSPLTLRGTDTLIMAFSMVKRLYPCKLLFLSRLDSKALLAEEELLKILAVKEKIDDSIEFVSRPLEPAEVKGYLAISNIVCLPFKIVISDIPISILEAMDLGIPVISTNVASIPDLIDGRGLIVEPNDPKELADAIISLLNDEKLAGELGKKGKNYMETYPTWEQVADEFIEIAKSLTTK